MTPKHSNPTRPRVDRQNARTQWAHAPYNFVPLPEKMVTANTPLDHDDYQGLTGWIECDLESVSPTFVRGMQTETQFNEDANTLTPAQKRERALFFSTTDAKVAGYLAPVIPGSSLRGMIRMLVEIVGYGRMRWVTDATPFTFRAVAAPRSEALREPYEEALGRFGRRVQAGYVEKEGNQWFVRPALKPISLGFPERAHYLKIKERQIDWKDIKGFVRFNSDGYEPKLYPVSFEAQVRSGKRGKYAVITKIGNESDGFTYKGFLVGSGNMLETSKARALSPRRNHPVVLAKDKEAERIPIPEQTIADYRNGLTPFQKKEIEEAWGGNLGCLAEGKPIFYVQEGNKVIYFGHSPNFRVPAQHAWEERASTPRDFIPDEIREGQEIDLADAIFGWVSEKDGPKEARAGRVFFGDAHFVAAKDGVWLSSAPITPRVLAEPKPTTFQHYLVQDKEQGHDPDDKSSLAHYATSPAETQLRGHKLYWHQGSAPDIEATYKERMHESQLTRIMPIKANVRFAFKIHFENLHEEELGALWWALALPGEPGKSYRHKLGMGKPLGMGAIAITPKLYLTNRQERYESLFQDDAWHEAAGETSPQPYLNRFERYVLDQIDPNAKRLADLERIQMLLAMLQWRTGSKEWVEQTRYMEIEHGPEAINQYKERPVLPTPLKVAESYSEPQELTVKLTATETLPGYQSGVVKRFGLGPLQSYGYILPDSGEEEVFVHRTQLRGGLRTLQVGQRVTFRTIKTLRGQLEARDIQLEKL